MDNCDFETRNKEAWDKIKAEKEVQALLRAEYDMDIDMPRTDKEIFCAYLRETADEIQGFRLSREYLDDVCGQLKDNINAFYKVQYENCRLHLVE